MHSVNVNAARRPLFAGLFREGLNGACGVGHDGLATVLFPLIRLLPYGKIHLSRCGSVTSRL